MSLSSYSLGAGSSASRSGEGPKKVKDLTRSIRERDFMDDNGTLLPNSFKPKVYKPLSNCQYVS